MDANEKKLGFVAEIGGGFLGTIARQFLGTRRSMEILIFNESGEEILKLKRPFYLFFSKLTVFFQGIKIGSVHRRLAFLYKLYDLRDSSGFVFSRIKAPLWRLWTFPIFNSSKRQIGKITKKWGGIAKEVFTDADRFQIQFPPCDFKQKATILSAALSIDLDFFERKR